MVERRAPEQDRTANYHSNGHGAGPRTVVPSDAVRRRREYVGAALLVLALGIFAVAINGLAARPAYGGIRRGRADCREKSLARLKF